MLYLVKMNTVLLVVITLYRKVVAVALSSYQSQRSSKSAAKNSADFLENVLPFYMQKQIEIINARCEFLYEKIKLFQQSF